MISGGPIEAFNGGWALIPFRGRLGHYWAQEQEVLRASGEPELSKGGRVRLWRSLCGLWGKTNRQIPPLKTGEFPHCKRCSAQAAKG